MIWGVRSKMYSKFPDASRCPPFFFSMILHFIILSDRLIDCCSYISGPAFWISVCCLRNYIPIIYEKMEVEKRSSKGGFLQLFDWNAKSRKKLFSNKPDLPGNSHYKMLILLHSCNSVLYPCFILISNGSMPHRKFKTRKRKLRQFGYIKASTGTIKVSFSWFQFF